MSRAKRGSSINLKPYYQLTKPGIIRGNLLTAAAGFLLAAGQSVNLVLLAALLAGTALIIASACVFNNYIDRGIDARMARTKDRALVSGAISGRNALIFASLLGLIGVYILAVFTNYLTLLIGLFGFVSYVVVYGYAKRKTWWGTLVGAVPGATPIIAGYVAVTGRLDLAAFLLFLILVTWQMAHFYAIATYRLKDYKQAAIPVLPAVKGVRNTQIQISLYALLFFIATIGLYVFGYTGYVYLVIMTVVSLAWLRLAILGCRATDVTKWAKGVFLFSLVVIAVFSLLLGLEAWLP